MSLPIYSANAKTASSVGAGTSWRLRYRGDVFACCSLQVKSECICENFLDSAIHHSQHSLCDGRATRARSLCAAGSLASLLYESRHAFITTIFSTTTPIKTAIPKKD